MGGEAKVLSIAAMINLKQTYKGSKDRGLGVCSLIKLIFNNNYSSVLFGIDLMHSGPKN